MASSDELRFDADAGELRLRIHRPVGAAAPAPALVYLHGGGFTLFSIDTHDRLMRELAAAGGFAVIGVDHPLSPEHKYPVALDRIEALMRWLFENGDDWGIDTARLRSEERRGGTEWGSTCSYRW